MADVIGERVAKLIEDRGKSQSSIARMIGVSQPSIGRLISGKTRSTSKVIELAVALGTTPEYLVGDVDDPAPALRDRQSRLTVSTTGDLVEVAEIDLRYGLGATYLSDVVEAETRQFSRAWLRHFTDSAPSELFWAKGQGNSMEGTIHDSDIVLIDRRQQTPRMADLIWACSYGEVGMIKRLRPMPDGSVKIMSDNPAVSPETAHDGELTIIGRVVAVVKRL